jgi:purine nucleosidase
MLSRRELCAALLALPAFRGAGATPAPSQSRKILLDTDIGSDIDDAVALAYLLRQPLCELLGITTVTGDANGRAALAAELCALAGRAVPIYPGAETPLAIAQRQTEAPQTRRLRGPRPVFPQGDAVDFLRDTIRAHPGEITLLAIGPWTNVAALFRADPEVAQLLHSLVLMGGKYSAYPTPWGPTEWNAIVDPHAAALVFAADVPRLTAFGLDITWQVSMRPGEVAERFRGDPLLEKVLDWSGVWFEERELLHFHDPLAAVALWVPDVCTYKQGTVAVELQPGPTMGVTHFTPDAPSEQKYADGVDSRRFFDAYFSVFKGQNRV